MAADKMIIFRRACAVGGLALLARCVFQAYTGSLHRRHGSDILRADDPLFFWIFLVAETCLGIYLIYFSLRRQ
ncbi:hypothetical protein ABB27_17965 [Stenotrophomonas terrae]|uniref:Uncharacterized protein n=1 Tax=Stenotrophomonas terrae TaxID=405446 RepID=A0A0R0C9Y7_9GAMM|nr:hypothetical protein ABB27_17965 [Stenotrophomonas terrae]